MKTCPVCNESFADQLNFCDMDGVRLAREGSAQERNSWWSLLGAGLLVGALIISAVSLIFLPKARVSAPIVNPEPQSQPAPPRQATVESPAAVAAAPALNTEPSTPSDVLVPEVKKKDKPLSNENVNAPAPNPKSAFVDEADNKTSIEVNTAAQPSAKKSEAPTPDSDARTADPATKPQPFDLKKDSKDQPANDKASEDKKKTDEKDKKKGGFLKVFKKIFGKDSKDGKD